VDTEHLVALDTQGTLDEISDTLRRQLDLFPDIENFQRARLFRAADGPYVLEIEYLADRGPSHQRRHLSDAAVDSLRLTIDGFLRRTAERPHIDHSGRGEFIFDQIILSLMLYGPAAPVLLDVSGSRSAVAAYMLTASAGFYVPYQLTRHTDVTHSHRHLAQYGSTRGIAYGLLLKHLLLGEGGVRRTAAYITGTSITSGAAGFAAADWLRCSRDQAELYGVMGDFGLLTGGGLAFVLNLYNDDATRRTGDVVTLVGAVRDCMPANNSGGATRTLGETPTPCAPAVSSALSSPFPSSTPQAAAALVSTWRVYWQGNWPAYPSRTACLRTKT